MALRSVRLLFGVLLLAGCQEPTALDAAEDEPAPREAEVAEAVPTGCGGDLLPPAVDASWVEVSDDSAIAVSSDGKLSLHLRNDAMQPIFITGLALRLVGGGNVAKAALADVKLEIDGEEWIAVDLGGSGFDVELVDDIAGEVSVNGKVEDAEGRSLENLAVPPLFFHDDTDELVVYGAKAMRNDFGAGDVNAKFQDQLDGGSSVRRVAQWTPGLESKL